MSPNEKKPSPSDETGTLGISLNRTLQMQAANEDGQPGNPAPNEVPNEDDRPIRTPAQD
jgi:hypothetical protein